MRRIVACPVATPAVLGMALSAALLLTLPGCGGEDKETGTTTQVSDQMLQDAKASDAYYMEQQKQSQAKGKRAGGS
jgi:hypothetical protein